MREEIDPAVEAELFLETTLDPEAGIKKIMEHRVKYSTREVGDYLAEMDDNGEFCDIELDAIAFRLC